MTKTELLQYWFDEVWGNGNTGIIPELLAPEAQITGVLAAQDLPGSEYSDLVMAITSLLGRIKVRFTHVMEDGDWLAVRYVADTERNGTGEPFQVSGQLFVRFEHGKIAESLSQFDFFTMFEKLGQLPPDALPICMTGQKLGWL